MYVENGEFVFLLVSYVMCMLRQENCVFVSCVMCVLRMKSCVVEGVFILKEPLSACVTFLSLFFVL